MMKLAPLTTSFALFALATGGACSDDASNATKYAASNLAGLCQQYGRALCDHAVACGIAASAADCAPYAAELEAGCARGTIEVQAQIDAGAVSVNYGVASACLAEVGSSCTASFDTCSDEKSLIVGKRAIGATCGDNDECVSGAFCNKEENACGGVCAATIAEGGTCTGDSSECASGLLCLDDKCQKGAAKGAACSLALECASGLECDGGICKTIADIRAACPVSDPSCNIGGMSCGTTAGGPTVCHFTYKTYGASGAACDPSGAEPANEDVTRACKLGLECDPTAKTCGPALAIGADCTERENACTIGAYCDAAHKCAKVPAENEACTETCADDLACIEGTCKMPLATGAACTKNDECASYDCADDGKCAAECTP